MNVEDLRTRVTFNNLLVCIRELRRSNVFQPLKVKIKSLAAEVQIIRIEERKVRGMERWDLQHHRKTKVRNAARRSLIAYAIIRGKDPSPNASHCAFTQRSDEKEVARMVKQYGENKPFDTVAA